MKISLYLTAVSAPLLALFVACSSTTTTSSSPSGADSGPPTGDDGGPQGDDDASPGTDAGATELLQVEVIDTTTPKSCADVCTADKYTCSTSCAFDDAGTAAGDAVYGDTGPGTNVSIAACTDVPAKTVSSQGLNNYVCCCLSPKHQLLAGTNPPKSCDDICTAKGLKCDPFTIWDGADTTTYMGGAHESYEGNGDHAFHVDDCSTVPAASYKGRTLTDYQCGCD